MRRSIMIVIALVAMTAVSVPVAHARVHARPKANSLTKKEALAVAKKKIASAVGGKVTFDHITCWATAKLKQSCHSVGAWSDKDGDWVATAKVVKTCPKKKKKKCTVRVTVDITNF
jgi:hypothetical protein